MEDVNQLQPVSEFLVRLVHGHEFVSNPAENPVILSIFSAPPGMDLPAMLHIVLQTGKLLLNARQYDDR